MTAAVAVPIGVPATTKVVRNVGPSTRLKAQQTLAQMRANVRTDLPLAIVWETAREIISALPPRDEVAQASAVRGWCDSHFKFVNDPIDVQLLTSPSYLLEHIRDNGSVQGNCADAAMLSAALCMAIHLPCRFYAVSFPSSPEGSYQHVFTVAYPALPAPAAVEMDFTRPPDLHKATFTRRLFLDV